MGGGGACSGRVSRLAWAFRVSATRFAIRVSHTNPLTLTLTGSATREPNPRKGPLNAYGAGPLGAT